MANIQSDGGINSNDRGDKKVVRGPERFFYDKTTYTGWHKKGGPSAWNDWDGKRGYGGLEQLINRDHVQNDWLHRKQGIVTNDPKQWAE